MSQTPQVRSDVGSKAFGVNCTEYTRMLFSIKTFGEEGNWK